MFYGFIKYWKFLFCIRHTSTIGVFTIYFYYAIFKNRFLLIKEIIVNE